MAYIGRDISNLSDRAVLDSITASATATYNLLLNSVAYVPSSAESLTVSLNGVIQKPQSSYTVSGSTIVFDSALTSSDSIDFILAERAITLTTVGSGSVGTTQLVDDAVTNAKVNDDLISGATELTSEPADTDEFLVSDAGTLKRIDYSLIKASNTPSFLAKMSGDQGITDDTETKVSFNSEVFDTDGKYDHSTNYRFTPTVAGTYFLFAQVHGKSNANSEITDYRITIKKNGSNLYSTRHNPALNYANQMALNIQVMDVADSDDYYEIFAFLNDASGNPTLEHDEGNGVTSWFGGYKLI